MHGTGVPLVTPFSPSGEIDSDALSAHVDWVLEQGVDFLVPCGSTSEAELMTLDERARVTEQVVDAAPGDVPVLAGTGHPGLAETLAQTERAADAGADAALVVTPHYYNHGQAALEAYYRELADTTPLPLYLYNMPGFTGVSLDPETVGSLADHDRIHGMKDSSGDLELFQRFRTATRECDFALFVGGGSIYAPALDAGADGGILAVANVVPERATEIYRLHRASKDAAARDVNRRVVALNHAITTAHGVPGLKAAMAARNRDGGHPRRPFQPVDAATEDELHGLVDRSLP